MGGDRENESTTSSTGHEKIKTTNTVVAQAEKAIAADSQPVKARSPFRFTWKVDRFSQMNTKKLYSDVVEVGGYKWRALIFPKGNNVDYLSMYLDVADSASLPYGWCTYAQFGMTLVNQIMNMFSLRKDSQHLFNPQQSDWGFTSFIPLSELNDPSRGYLVNDTLVVEVEVLVRSNPDENGTAEHSRGRLKKEEADLNTIIKVVRDEDLAEQIGKDIYFDLVDHDKVKSFCVRKHTSFKVFKEEVAKEFGIPARFQRFWLWEKRQNHTFRPSRPLTHIEEAQSVGQLRAVRNVVEAELKLFLEVQRGRDLRPIAPLKRRGGNILLFFKLYDSEKEELRYVGRLLVNGTGKPSEILTRLNKLAGYNPDEEIRLYEEIKFEPNVMCEPVDKNLTFNRNQLENGDIICFQKAPVMDNEKHICYPDVPSYLEYVHNRQVPFSPLATESEDENSLEELNKNILAEEMIVDKIIEAQQSKRDIETTYDEGTSKSNSSKLVSIDLEEIDAMIDEDVIAAIDKVLSGRITLSLKSQHSVQRQEVAELDPNLPEQLLQELRDIAFKEDLVEKFKEGLTPKVNFDAVKEKIDANADLFSSNQLEQVSVVVDLLNNMVRMFEKLENLKKELDSAKKSTSQDNEALKETRQKILTSRTSFTNHQTQLDSLDSQIADLKAKLKKLQVERAKISEVQDQEKDKITSYNKEVKSIFHRLANDQIKLKSVEDEIPEARTELENHEKLYRIFKATPPF
ncbi:ubiquitin carboxyl-terminal hydrolase [Trifolium repens]|nr:ubiquitin carboxyl-terminal hydrolase [Trifolium repens]